MNLWAEVKTWPTGPTKFTTNGTRYTAPISDRWVWVEVGNEVEISDNAILGDYVVVPNGARLNGNVMVGGPNAVGYSWAVEDNARSKSEQTRNPVNGEQMENNMTIRPDERLDLSDYPLENLTSNYLTSSQRVALFREVHHGELWPMDWPAKAIEMLGIMEDHADAADLIIDDLRKTIHNMMAHAGAVHPDIGCRAVIAAGKEALEKHRGAAPGGEDTQQGA